MKDTFSILKFHSRRKESQIKDDHEYLIKTLGYKIAKKEKVVVKKRRKKDEDEPPKKHVKYTVDIDHIRKYIQEEELLTPCNLTHDSDYASYLDDNVDADEEKSKSSGKDIPQIKNIRFIKSKPPFQIDVESYFEVIFKKKMLKKPPKQYEQKWYRMLRQKKRCSFVEIFNQIYNLKVQSIVKDLFWLIFCLNFKKEEKIMIHKCRKKIVSAYSRYFSDPKKNTQNDYLQNLVACTIAYIVHYAFFDMFVMDREIFDYRFVLDCYHTTYFELNGSYITDLFIQRQLEKNFNKRFLQYRQKNKPNQQVSIQKEKQPTKNVFNLTQMKMNFKKNVKQRKQMRELEGGKEIMDMIQKQQKEDMNTKKLIKQQLILNPQPRARSLVLENAEQIKREKEKLKKLTADQRLHKLKKEFNYGLRFNCHALSPTVGKYLDYPSLGLPQRKAKYMQNIHTKYTSNFDLFENLKELYGKRTNKKRKKKKERLNKTDRGPNIATNSNYNSNFKNEAHRYSYVDRVKQIKDPTLGGNIKGYFFQCYNLRQSLNKRKCDLRDHPHAVESRRQKQEYFDTHIRPMIMKQEIQEKIREEIKQKRLQELKQLQSVKKRQVWTERKKRSQIFDQEDELDRQAELNFYKKVEESSLPKADSRHVKSKFNKKIQAKVTEETYAIRQEMIKNHILSEISKRRHNKYRNNKKKYFKTHSMHLKQSTDNNLLQIVKKIQSSADQFQAELDRVDQVKRDKIRKQKELKMFIVRQRQELLEKQQKKKERERRKLEKRQKGMKIRLRVKVVETVSNIK